MAKKGGKGKKPTQAQRRRWYEAAGLLGTGLVVGIMVGVVVWVATRQPPREDRVVREDPQVGSSPAPVPHPPAPRQRPEHRGEGLMDRGPRAAIIIDDMGNSWSAARTISRLPFPVAVAVLPDTPYAVRTARRAHARGKEVLVHMPMQPMDDSIPLGPTFLREGMARGRLQRIMRSDLQEIPYAEGINNHMGSALTADAKRMGWVMDVLRHRGLLFIDSRTTAATQGLAQAKAAGIPTAARDVFLDNRPNVEYVRRQFRRLLKEARAQGTAIAIGHPHPATLKVLREMLPTASAAGVEIVPVREVVAVRDRDAPPPGGTVAYQPHHNEGEGP
ncbi:MAG TPA: divergent polysaccharide deacetylase family protein [Gammaproteobacteria bacterium]|nr:divergent polysaccharide deacetylase family protein [Gammaproteobacteria bacterium]